MKQLTDNFINELFKLSLRNKQVFEIARQHIKYNYLPSEPYKEIWQSMIEYYDLTEKLMTIGLLSQKFSHKPKVIDVINNINKAQTPDADDIVSQLETFIKNKMFIDAYDQLYEKFNKDDKQAAFELMGSVAEQLKNFQIFQKVGEHRVFADFNKRQDDRVTTLKQKAEFLMKRKVPTGIYPLDRKLHGGIDKGDTMLILADSGVGKSKMLKHIGLSAARRGYRVVHIQAEGTLSEATEAYDAAIAGVTIHDIETGNLTKQQRQQIDDALHILTSQGGEIHIKAFEQFDSGNMRDVHAFCQQIQDKYGEIDLIVLDYLDEVEPGDGRYFKNQDGLRLQKRASAKKFKNICVEFDSAGATATQANDIKDADKENPEFVLKRGNTSENKKLLQPFSYMVTLNRTSDEEQNNIMRLYIDKIRKYAASNRLIHIVTNFEHERFYNHKKTMQKFGLYE